MFGLGGSGLVSARALMAGGADVVASDDNADSVEEGRSRRHSDSRFACDRLDRARRAGAGAGRAADPSRAALERRTGAQGRRAGDRGHRAVLPRTPPARAGRAVCRHHRHQRQIDHHRADRASCGVRRHGRSARRQYRHGDPLAGAATGSGRQAFACSRHRMLVLSDRSRALARSVDRDSDQSQRRSSRPARHDGALRGGERAAGGGRAARGYSHRRRR